MLSQIGPLLEEHLLVLLVALVLARVHVLLPLRSPARHECTIPALWAVFVSTVALAAALYVLKGISYLVFSARINGYFDAPLRSLIARNLLHWLQVFVIVAGVAAVLVVVYLLTIDALLSRLKPGSRLTTAATALPAFVFFFLVAGFWLNRAVKSFFSFSLTSALDSRSGLLYLLLLATCGLLSLVVARVLMRFGSVGARPSPNRALALVGLLFCVFAVFGKGLHEARLSRLNSHRPNVLLISVDTLRADHLSLYGYERPTSPNLDRLAKQAVVFETAIVQAPWTLPSHISIFTGLYPSNHGVIDRGYKLEDKFTTLAELFQASGYVTAAFTGGAYVSSSYGYQGFDHFEGKNERAENTFEKAMKWLRTEARKPFFLFLHTYEVHAPYVPPAPYDAFSDKSYSGMVTLEDKKGAYFKEILPQMTAEDFQYVIDKYDGEILYVDTLLGELFEQLETSGRDEDTIVIVTSDHGEDFAADTADSRLGAVGHLIGHHAFFDSVIRVPLIVKGPRVPGGRRIAGQVESVDLFPTLAALAGIKRSGDIDGRSLLPLIERGAGGKQFTFAEGRKAMMVRTDEWKLIQGLKNGDRVLLSLDRDPEERLNLFESEPETARALAEELARWSLAVRSGSAPRTKAGEDERLRRELKALGYIE